MATIVKLTDSAFHIYESHNVFCTLVIGSERALLIDTGFGCRNVMDDVAALTSLPVIVAYTHGHIDHAYPYASVPEVRVHRDDVALYRKNTGTLIKLVNALWNPIKADRDEKLCYFRNYAKKRPRIIELEDGNEIDLGDTVLKVISTPGHTKGSVCFLDGKNKLLYCGDSVSNHVWVCLKESTTVSEYAAGLERLRTFIDGSFRIVASHSEEPLNTAVLDRLIACARRVDPAKSAKYRNWYCKNSYVYSEGLEVLTARYGITSFDEMVANLAKIDKGIFRDGLFVSVVFKKDKL